MTIKVQLSVVAVSTVLAFAALALGSILDKNVFIRNVVTIEDHPWVIKNETCLTTTGNKSCSSPCYSGFLIDMLSRIESDLKRFNNCTFHDFDSFGVMNNGVWSGIMGELVKNKSDLALAVFNITSERKKAITLSAPMINNVGKNITLSLGFPKGSKLEPAFSHMIKKLVNQRHIDQLTEKWFNEEDSWSEKKQRTIYLPKRVNNKNYRS